ncbi:MAG: acetyl-CoA carboxylase biotin carboxyl carrier protein, partial [Planctomycetota bacterium]
YASASPDVDPYVQVGAQVGADTVVCIVEAMKVFNEIKAEVSGTVHKVLVSNGDAVEFGQPLFQVKPG